MIDELRRLLGEATKGPWAWESVGEKSSEFAIGIAYDKNNKPLSGEIPSGYDEENDAFFDTEILRSLCVGINETGSANYSDARLICALRNHAEALLAVCEAAEECSKQYFYDDCEEYDDVKYDEAMQILRAALAERDRVEEAATRRGR
jgi:hypothetical protein